MSLAEGASKRWTELCARHEAAWREVECGAQAIAKKFLGIDGSGPSNPNAVEIARLDDARARRAGPVRELARTCSR